MENLRKMLNLSYLAKKNGTFMHQPQLVPKYYGKRQGSVEMTIEQVQNIDTLYKSYITNNLSWEDWAVIPLVVQSFNGPPEYPLLPNLAILSPLVSLVALFLSLRLVFKVTKLIMYKVRTRNIFAMYPDLLDIIKQNSASPIDTVSTEWELPTHG